MEWTPPQGARRVASGVLAGFGSLAEVRQVGIDAALERDVALADAVAQAIEETLTAQPIELGVRVEDERRPGKTARDTRACRMQPNDEERAAAEAEREARVGGVVAHVGIPARRRVVAFVQPLQLEPEPSLEFRLTPRIAPREDRDERSQRILDAKLACLVGEAGEAGGQCGGGRWRAKRAVDLQLVIVAALLAGRNDEAAFGRCAEDRAW